MNHLTNRLVVLAVAVVVILMAAAIAFQYKQHHYSTTEQLQKFLPGLQEKLQQATTIEISQQGNSLVIDKQGSDWVLLQKGGYMVDISKVRQLALSLAELEKIEAKTANPERFSDLGLEVPSSENNATRIAIFDAEGQALADVIIGSLRRTQGASIAEGAFYIRNSNEDQTWLVKGSIDASVQENDWVNRELLRLNSKHIASLTITHPKQKAKLVQIIRSQLEDGTTTTFKLANLPDGKTLSSQMDIDAMVDVVTRLNFLEVVNTKEKDFDKSKAIEAYYQLDGGLNVILNIWKEKSGKGNEAKDRYWLAVEHNISGDKATTDTSINDVAARLKQYEGWLYEIGGYQGKLLTKSLSQLTKK